MRLRFRTGLVLGFAAGYYLGAKAGRERYHEIEHWLDRVRGTSQYLDARSRLDDLAARGRLRTVGLLDEATGGAASTILDVRGDGHADDDSDHEPTA